MQGMTYKLDNNNCCTYFFQVRNEKPLRQWSREEGVYAPKLVQPCTNASNYGTMPNLPHWDQIIQSCLDCCHNIVKFDDLSCPCWMLTHCHIPIVYYMIVQIVFNCSVVVFMMCDHSSC